MILKSVIISFLSIVIVSFFVSCQGQIVEETIPQQKNVPIITCSGDFQSASDFLIQTIIQPLKDTSIVLKSTPKSEVVKILTEETFIEKNFEGIRLDGYITFEDDQLQKINYAYFYDCKGLNDRLLNDRLNLIKLITSVIGEPGLSSGIDHTASYFWDLNEQTIALSFFNDGYSLSVFPCI